MPFANFFIAQNGEWPTLHDVRGIYLNCFTLPSTEVPELLRLLFALDMTPYHLMPTLGSAARAVAYKKALLR